MMTGRNGGCWKSEYDWDVFRPGSQSRETVLTILFDFGAQLQFSSIRISLLLSDDVAPEQSSAWCITPPCLASSLSIVSHSSALDKPVITPNDPSLPICHIVFIAGCHSARSQSIAVEIAKLCGEIVLSEPESLRTSSSTKLFEFNHPLTENTQSVSISFISSYLLSTMISHGVFPVPLSAQPAIVGRTVRVVPTSHRRTVSLPTDVLLIVFENLHSPLTYRGWRQDLLNCALVCRRWTCALSMLLVDFRSQESQQGHPPEIVRFSKGLAAHPSLAFDIKHLSAGYLEKHPTWDPFPVLPPGTPSPMFLARLRLQQSDVRRSHFAQAFLSILHAVRNIRTLVLDTANPLVCSPTALADALSGLNELDSFHGRCTLTLAQLLSCVITWPSLKRLFILSVLHPSPRSVPPPVLSCHLIELSLMDVPVRDDELTCLVSASSTTLQRLTLNCTSDLTNAGLRAALTSVCGTLTYLHIVTNALERAQGEEHALDAIISCMGRLTELEIVPEVASERMVERRSDAFARQRACAATSLSEVRLRLLLGHTPVPDGGLIIAAERGWPGWRMDNS